MKYKLLVNSKESNHQITCACGKCEPMITIDESMREEFRKMMGWDESEFIRRTVIIKDDDALVEKSGAGGKE